MSQFVNTDKIIEAFISKPYENSGEPWDLGNTHGWEVVLVTGYNNEGYPYKITIPEESEIDCIKKMNKLVLIQVS